jgi:hypothetical protein
MDCRLPCQDRQIIFSIHYFFPYLALLFYGKKLYTFVAIISHPQAMKVFSPGTSSRKIHGKEMDGGAGNM